jgi:hypothetical protein
MEFILGLFLLILPKGHCLLDSMEKIKKVVRDLGLTYEKIDACYNDCVLFRGKEYEGLHAIMNLLMDLLLFPLPAKDQNMCNR